MSLKFKTNIMCNGCIAKVTPKLNETVGENGWQVDLADADRVLSVDAHDDKSQTIMDTVKGLGYNIERI